MPKLPIVDRPPITSYLHHAFPLAIVLVDPQRTKWVLERYVDLYASCIGPVPIGMDYLEDPRTEYDDVLQRVSLCPGDIEDGGNAAVLTKEAIDAQNYVLVCLDEFYIRQTQSYGNSHFVHATLFRGYDDERELFHCLRQNARGVLTEMAIAFGDVQIGFREALAREKWGITQHWQHHGYIVQLLRPKQDREKCRDVDRTRLAQQIMQYHHSSAAISALRSRFGLVETQLLENPYNIPPLLVGSNVNKGLMCHIKGVEVGWWPLDFRLFHLIHEHRTGLLSRVQVLLDGLPHVNSQAKPTDLAEWERLIQLSSGVRVVALRAALEPYHSRGTLQILFEQVRMAWTMEQTLLAKLLDCVADICPELLACS